MTIIVVSKIPRPWKHDEVLQILAPSIGGKFKVLKYFVAKNFTKVCHIELLEELDVAAIIKKIRVDNARRIGAPLTAHIQPHDHKRKRMLLPVDVLPKIKLDPKSARILMDTFSEILDELVLTYCNLQQLSKMYDHVLLDRISLKIWERFLTLVQNNDISLRSYVVATGEYRRYYPFDTDWALITECSSEVDKELEFTEPTVLDEVEMKTVRDPYQTEEALLNRLYDKCKEFADPLVSVVQNHINSMDTEPNENDTEDEVVQKKVRRELKKVGNYMDVITRQLVTKDFQNKKKPMKMKMYGYPHMPTIKDVAALFKGFKTTQLHRSPKMYNCVNFAMPSKQLMSLVEAIEKNPGNFTYTVRPYARSRYRTPEFVLTQLRTLCPDMLEKPKK